MKVFIMGQVSITVNNRTYQVACDDGQEAHLSRLGDYVNKRIDQLVASVGQVGDSRLLVMVSLLLADELSDLHAQGSGSGIEDEKNSEGSVEISVFLEKLASHLEKIALEVEQST